jgi:replicative DNA helicase
MAVYYNEAIEGNVLSILFNDGSLYSVVEDILEKDSFGWSPYGVVFLGIKLAVDVDLYPDVETVANELDKRGLLSGLSTPSGFENGKAVLEYLKNLNISPDLIENYAFQVSELRAARQLIVLADKVKKGIEVGKRPIEILGMMDLESGKISAHVGSVSHNTRTSKDVVENNIKQFQDAIAGKSRYIKTRLRAWDEYVGGIAPRFYMIAAEQNEGKSTLVINLIYNLAVEPDNESEKVKVKLFTFESSAEEINNKLVQRQTGISQIRIEQGTLSDEELESYQKALEKIAKSPIVYDDSSDITLPLLRTKIRKAVADGARVIFIDQTEQIMIGGAGDAQPEHIRINYITYRLKAYQREMDIPIIAVHQNKKVTSQGGAEHRGRIYDYVLNDLNQAGGKAPNAVVMVRTTSQPALFWVKNREGKKGKVDIGWEGDRLRFYDLDSKESPPSNYVQQDAFEGEV